MCMGDEEGRRPRAERERERERESVCVCVCEREREREGESESAEGGKRISCLSLARLACITSTFLSLAYYAKDEC